MALPPDPDLAPIEPPPGGFPQAAAAPAPAASKRPVVVPAEPERWTRRLTLQFPLAIDGERLETITATALTGQELLECVLVTSDDRVLGLMVRAAMCKLPHEVFAALHADDGQALEELLRPLLPAVIRRSEGEDDGSPAAEAAAEG